MFLLFYESNQYDFIFITLNSLIKYEQGKPSIIIQSGILEYSSNFWKSCHNSKI